MSLGRDLPANCAAGGQRIQVAREVLEQLVGEYVVAATVVDRGPPGSNWFTSCPGLRCLAPRSAPRELTPLVTP
jgi:hypothetical protein